MYRLAFKAETVIPALESKPPKRYLKLFLEKRFLICPCLIHSFLYRARCGFFFLLFSLFLSISERDLFLHSWCLHLLP